MKKPEFIDAESRLLSRFQHRNGDFVRIDYKARVFCTGCNFEGILEQCKVDSLTVFPSGCPKCGRTVTARDLE